jgi:hypothetical protein
MRFLRDLPVKQIPDIISMFYYILLLQYFIFYSYIIHKKNCFISIAQKPRIPLRPEIRFRARIKNPTLQKKRKIFAFKNLVLKEKEIKI